MKNLKKFILFSLAIFACSDLLAKGDLFVAGGSGWSEIAIINKDDNKVIRKIPIPQGGECNSVRYSKGKIAFSFAKGVSVVSEEGDLLLEYNVEKGQEAQSISVIKGGYLVGICGTPSRILELNKYGDIKKEITYDIGIKHAHGQHRQITKAKNGNYIVPVMGAGKVIELDSEGKTVREVKVGGVPFSVQELKNGNWLVSCGDAGYFVEVNPATSEIIEKVDSSVIGDGIKLGFVAETIRLKNGNTILCNWLGHGADPKQPIVIELNPDNKIVWKIPSNTPEIGAISTICPF